MINFQKMMQQAQEMQTKLQEMQLKFQDLEVSGESGGGLVKVTITCKGDLKTLDIDSSLTEDKETMEDLIIAAVNNANSAKDQKIEEETKRMMQEMGLPEGAMPGGAGGLPFAG